MSEREGRNHREGKKLEHIKTASGFATQLAALTAAVQGILPGAAAQAAEYAEKTQSDKIEQAHVIRRSRDEDGKGSREGGRGHMDDPPREPKVGLTIKEMHAMLDAAQARVSEVDKLAAERLDHELYRAPPSQSEDRGQGRG